MRDGTGLLQAVLVKNAVSPDAWERFGKLTQETSIEVEGEIIDFDKAVFWIAIFSGTCEFTERTGEDMLQRRFNDSFYLIGQEVVEPMRSVIVHHIVQGGVLFIKDGLALAN